MQSQFLCPTAYSPSKLRFSNPCLIFFLEIKRKILAETEIFYNTTLNLLNFFMDVMRINFAKKYLNILQIHDKPRLPVYDIYGGFVFNLCLYIVNSTSLILVTNFCLYSISNRLFLFSAHGQNNFNLYKLVKKHFSQKHNLHGY